MYLNVEIWNLKFNIYFLRVGMGQNAYIKQTNKQTKENKICACLDILADIYRGFTETINPNQVYMYDLMWTNNKLTGLALNFLPNSSSLKRN